MPRASPILSSFNAGELSPSLMGRTDFDKYKSGCELLENFIPLVQGPAERRPGTHYTAPVANEAQKTWLVPFEFSQTQSYVIELGDVYARFFYQRAQLLNFGTPYQIAAPWGSSDLTNADGTLSLTYAQSNDILFFAHPRFFPQMLSRFGHTNWTFGIFSLGAGFQSYQYAFQFPFRSQNTDTGKTLYANTHSGLVNLTAASGFIFEPWMVNCLIMIEQPAGTSVPAWEPGKLVGANQFRHVDARVYFTGPGGTTGSVKPTHTEGTKPDGDPGVAWQFVHAGYGVAQITGVLDGAHATANVFTQLPDEVLGAGNATYRWSISAWNSNDLYPNLVGFFRERLYFIRGTTLWFSSPGDFFNFAERDRNGDVTADQAITVTLASDTADPVRWARETAQGLLVGSDGGEWLIGETTPTDPLGPANIQAKKQSAYGTASVAAISVQHSVLYVQRGRRKLREAVWDIYSEKMKSRDLTVLAEHITRSGLTSMAFQQEPRSTLWCTRADGVLLSFTYNAEQDVYGWHRHPLAVGSGGDAHIECVCVVPSPDGGQDDLYMVVQRTFGAVVHRYVEWLDRGYEDGDDPALAWYLDCGAVYDGIPATVISGLTHLVGETVAILADGAVHPDRLVDGSGQITLAAAASKVIVGLRSRARLRTVRVEAGAADGTAQGKTSRINRMHVRFRNTVGCKVGPTFDKLDEITFRDRADRLDAAVPPFTGDKELPWPGGYDLDRRVCIQQDDPLPITVVAIMPQLVTMDS